MCEFERELIYNSSRNYCNNNFLYQCEFFILIYTLVFKDDIKSVNDTYKIIFFSLIIDFFF